MGVACRTALVKVLVDRMQKDKREEETITRTAASEESPHFELGRRSLGVLQATEVRLGFR
jgi:hypothetical protein